MFVSFTEDCTLQSEIYNIFIYSFAGSNSSISNNGNLITITAEKSSNAVFDIILTNNTNYVFSFDCKVHCYAGGSVSNQVNRFGIHLGNIQFQRDVGATSNFSSLPFPYNSWFRVELHREENSVFAIINNNKSSTVSIDENFTNKCRVRKWSDGALYRAGEIYLQNFQVQ